MDQERLPKPVTREEEFLHAIARGQQEVATELRRLNGQVLGIRKDLKALRQPPVPEGQVILKEPGKHPGKFAGMFGEG